MSEGIDRTSPAKKKRVRIHETTLENDIRYRGPISYQGFQVLGWLCLVVSVAVAMVNLAAKLDPAAVQRVEKFMPVLTTLSELSLPFLLIANFSRILNNSEGYKKQLFRTGGTALAIFAVPLRPLHVFPQRPAEARLHRKKSPFPPAFRAAAHRL